MNNSMYCLIINYLTLHKMVPPLLMLYAHSKPKYLSLFGILGGQITLFKLKILSKILIAVF